MIFPSLGGEGLCQAALHGPYPAAPLPFTVWLYAFTLTLGCEMVVMVLCFRGLDRRKRLAVLTANLLTHPAAIFLWIPFAAGSLELTGQQVLLSAELTIPFLETLVYLGFGFRGRGKTLLAAIAANFVSWTAVAWLSAG